MIIKLIIKCHYNDPFREYVFKKNHTFASQSTSMERYKKIKIILYYVQKYKTLR